MANTINVGGQNFDLSKMSPEQAETMRMQKAMQAEKAADNMAQLYMQNEQEKIKSRMDALSNIMKSMSDSKSNITNNLK